MAQTKNLCAQISLDYQVPELEYGIQSTTMTGVMERPILPGLQQVVATVDGSGVYGIGGNGGSGGPITELVEVVGSGTGAAVIPNTPQITVPSTPAYTSVQGMAYQDGSIGTLVQLEPDHTTTLELTNIIKPTLKVLKVDSITKSPIANVKFQIWRGSDDTITGELNDLGVYYTNEAGEIVLEHIDTWWYRIRELEPAPASPSKRPIPRIST